MKWGWDGGKVRRVVSNSTRSDRRESCDCGWCQSYYIKKWEVKRKYNFIVHGDEHKKEIDLDHRTKPIAIPVLGQVMLNLLWLQSMIDFFSTTRLSIKKFTLGALTSSPLPSGILKIRKSQKIEESKNRALYRRVFKGSKWPRVEIFHSFDQGWRCTTPKTSKVVVISFKRWSYP